MISKIVVVFLLFSIFTSSHQRLTEIVAAKEKDKYKYTYVLYNTDASEVNTTLNVSNFLNSCRAGDDDDYVVVGGGPVIYKLLVVVPIMVSPRNLYSPPMLLTNCYGGRSPKKLLHHQQFQVKISIVDVDPNCQL